MGPRDRAIYKWETEVLYPRDTLFQNEHIFRSVALHVWGEMGLSNPPLFKWMPVSCGHADRTEVVVPHWGGHCYLFHEMAHAMDVSLESSYQEYGIRPEGESMTGSCHDDNWLGLYVDMMDRFIGGPAFNKLWLYKTLADRGLSVSYAPRPRCI